MRTYLPDAYCDEIIPATRATPEAWLEQKPGFHPPVWRLAKAWSTDEEEGREVAPGDVVGFIARDEHGEVMVKIERAGGFKVLGPVPPEAKHFWDAETDVLGDTIEEFVKAYVEEGWSDETKKSVEVLVTMQDWSNAIHFRLAIVDGKPVFEQARIN